MALSGVSFELDALYYIDQYWTRVVGGVQLTIEPPEGWVEGDTGTLYVLTDCGSVTVKDGLIVSPKVPFLSWVGLKKTGA